MGEMSREYQRLFKEIAEKLGEDKALIFELDELVESIRPDHSE